MNQPDLPEHRSHGPGDSPGISAAWRWAVDAAIAAGATAAQVGGSYAATSRDRAQLVVFAYQAGLVRPGWAD